MTGRYGRAAAGFTLVEVLVALAIFGLLAAASAGVLNRTLGAKEAIAAKDETLRRFQVARALLKDDLGQIVPVRVRGAYGGTDLEGFRGGIRGDDGPILAFVRRGIANPNSRAARSSLRYVEYRLDDGRLIRRSRARVHPSPDTPTRDRVLLADVSDVTLAFRTGQRDVPRWQSRAGATGVLPRAVILNMTVAGLGPVRQLFLTPGGGGE